jgi:hypothetical protein
MLLNQKSELSINRDAQLLNGIEQHITGDATSVPLMI